MARCAPMVNELGDPPTLAEQFDANVTLVRDMGLMHKVITCCDTVADQGGRSSSPRSAQRATALAGRGWPLGGSSEPCRGSTSGSPSSTRR